MLADVANEKWGHWMVIRLLWLRCFPKISLSLSLSVRITSHKNGNLSLVMSDCMFPQSFGIQVRKNRLQNSVTASTHTSTPSLGSTNLPYYSWDRPLESGFLGRLLCQVSAPHLALGIVALFLCGFLLAMGWVAGGIHGISWARKLTCSSCDSPSPRRPAPTSGWNPRGNGWRSLSLSIPFPEKIVPRCQLQHQNQHGTGAQPNWGPRKM